MFFSKMREYNSSQKKKFWKRSNQNFQMGLIILVLHGDNDEENPNWTNLTGTGLLISLDFFFFFSWTNMGEEGGEIQAP